MSDNTVPAAMPGEEEIARAIYNVNLSSLNDDPLSVLIHCSEFIRDDVPLADQLEQVMQACRDIAKPVAALFAPIMAEKESLRRELHSLAVALHRKHYWHVKQWKPFDDALGLATQIDNMTAGLVPEARALAAEAALAAERERCIAIVDGYDPTLNARTGFADEIAAAIRAQGE